MNAPAHGTGGPIAAGTKIDHYRVLERIGGGGTGTVYSAEDETSGGRVALKILRPAFSEDASAKARFLREARAANEIDHPAIVRVLDSGTLPDGRPYLVLPLLLGRSLGEALAQDGPLAPHDAWPRVRPVAEALARAHSRGVIHRDIKPDNIFLARAATGHEVPRLLDFGLAKALSGEEAEQAAKLTQTGVPMGTPAYMAPEQWWGLAPSPSVNQYAFGATLFELLTGHPPFEASSFAALIEQHLHTPPPSPGEHAEANVNAFILRLLAKDPEARFASMDDVLDAGDLAFHFVPSAAHDSDLALGATLPAASEAITSAASSGLSLHKSPSIRGFLRWHLGVVAIGFGGLVAVGYAGEARHDVREWILIGGFPQQSTVLLFLVAAVVFPRAARKRPGHKPRGAWLLALAPAVSGVLGVYPNLQAVERGILEVSGIDAFRVFCQGTYEANASRFVGFALAAMLCASLVGLPAAAAPSLTTGTVATAQLRTERRAQLAALCALTALALAAALLAAPSGALVAGSGALCLLGAVLFPLDARPSSARATVSRAVASLFAVGLAFAVGVARVEARQAALWSEPASRAARVIEILGARAEMRATLLLGSAALLGAALPFALSLSRIARAGSFPRPTRAMALLAAAIGLVAAFDITMHERFLRRREELRAELAPQFATFVHLNPPPADALDPEKFAPRRATALQIARDAVAVNGRGVAKLAALDTETGLFHVTAALHQALAQAAVESGEGEVDLAVTADENVPFGRIVRLLALARGAGARRVDLLFRRGPKPSLSTDGLPETSYVVPTDFIAARAELADDGFSDSPEKSWSEVAPLFLLRASGETPVRLAVPNR